ncbi:MFS transporter [Salinisphaera sp. SPP-AMP-43]|uniref:MFS transporter n=1 Tax=Salinisphaera sp. SPP-AMP-43 TaxID=3121288 RepID=UPI003C6DFED4
MLSVSGALATAVAFGPARMGFGLFVPIFREQFGLSTALAGTIASGAFGGFFLALVLTALAIVRVGPRLPVTIGSLFGLLGMGMVAAADGLVLLATGTILAATAAGCCWSPFNNAAQRDVPRDRQARMLSIVSTGTTVGVAIAALLAMAMIGLQQSWRIAWLAFAGFALLSAVFNLLTLRHLARLPHASDQRTDFRQLIRPCCMPLYGIALSFGISSGIYLSFAVDHISAAGGLAGIAPSLAGPVLYAAFGAGGLVGLLTAEVEYRVGLTSVIRTIFGVSAASLALIALLPAQWSGVLISGAMQGMCVMVLSAVFAFWSKRLFPELPTVGLSSVLCMYALGNMLGPIAGGYIATASNLAVMLLGTGALSLVTAVAFPSQSRRRRREPAYG